MTEASAAEAGESASLCTDSVAVVKGSCRRASSSLHRRVCASVFVGVFVERNAGVGRQSPSAANQRPRTHLGLISCSIPCPAAAKHAAVDEMHDIPTQTRAFALCLSLSAGCIEAAARRGAACSRPLPVAVSQSASGASEQPATEERLH